MKRKKTSVINPVIRVKKLVSGKLSFELHQAEREEIYGLLMDYYQTGTTPVTGHRLDQEGFQHHLLQNVLLEFYSRHGDKLGNNMRNTRRFLLTKSEGVALWWLLSDEQLTFKEYPTAWNLREQLHKHLS